MAECDVCAAVKAKKCYACRWCTDETMCDQCKDKALFNTEHKICPRCGAIWEGKRLVYIAPSMREWLEKFYPGYVRLVEIGHVDLITEGMFKSYCAWCKRRRVTNAAD